VLSFFVSFSFFVPFVFKQRKRRRAHRAPLTGAQQLSAFQHGWIVIAATALLAALSGGVLLGTARPRPDRARESARWSGAAATPPALPERR